MTTVSEETRRKIAAHVEALVDAQAALDVAINRASLDGTASMLMISLDVSDSALGRAQDEARRQHQNSPAVIAARSALNDLLVSIGVLPEAWAQVYAEAIQRAKRQPTS